MPNTELSGEVLGHRLLYRPTEAAALLGISRSNLYILMASGEIESIRIGEHGASLGKPWSTSWLAAPRSRAPAADSPRQVCGTRQPTTASTADVDTPPLPALLPLAMPPLTFEGDLRLGMALQDLANRLDLGLPETAILEVSSPLVGLPSAEHHYIADPASASV